MFKVINIDMCRYVLIILYTQKVAGSLGGNQSFFLH